MKFLHLADLHLGKQLSGFSLIDDQRFALENLLSDAVERNVDALILAGDIYDKSVPSAEATSLLDWFLTEAAARKLKVFAVPGNHDSAERVAYASDLIAHLGVHIPAVYNGSIERTTFEDDHGVVNLWLIPFLKPAHVRPYFPDADIGQDYTAALRTALDSIELDAAQRNIAIAHQFVTSAGSEPQRSDSELNIGGLDNVDASVFDAFDYVALGHIHRGQRTGRDTVRYAGSLLKYSASEAAGDKSAVLVDVGPKTDEVPGSCISFELMPLRPLHDLRAIRGPLEQITAPAVIGAADADDYLAVTLTDEQAPLDALARLRAAYPNIISLDYDNERTRHAAQGAPSRLVDDDFDPFELFARFYKEQNGMDLDDDQRRLVAETLALVCDPERSDR